MNVLLFLIFRFHPGSYPEFYWQCESISIGLRFFVVWEVFHQVFRGSPGLYRTASKGLATLALVPIGLSLCAFLSLNSTERLIHIYFMLERSSDFVQAFLALGILAAARYYHVRLRRSNWGILIGFGLFTCISTAAFAMVDVKTSLIPLMRDIAPASFVGMLVMWTWALWAYTPGDAPATDEPAAEHAAVAWWSAWTDVLTAIRRTKDLNS